MGTAREPVAGSGDWPAWTARVANWRCFASDMVDSLDCAFWGVGGLGLWCGEGRLRAAPKKQNGPNPFRTRAAWLQDSVASSAFAAQEPHGQARTPYTCP